MPPNKLADAPSMRKHAQLMGIPKSTFHRVDKSVMDKRAQLNDEEERVYWARCKKKKGYSAISDDTKTFLIGAFYDHPHVIVSPSAKDTDHVVPVRNVMSMVRLGTFFSDIVRENSTIKNKVRKRAFRYIITALG